MTSDRTCLVRSFALSPGDRPVNPAVLVAPDSSFLTFPEGLPVLQPHASDANTIQRQHGTRSRHADRQETGRPANHRVGAPTQSTPREQASLVDSGHPQGILHKTLVLRTNPGISQPPPAFIFWSAEFQRHPPPEPVGFPRGSVDPRPAERYSNPVGKNLDSTFPNSTRRRSLPTIGFQSPSRSSHRP